MSLRHHVSRRVVAGTLAIGSGVLALSGVTASATNDVKISTGSYSSAGDLCGGTSTPCTGFTITKVRLAAKGRRKVGVRQWAFLNFPKKCDGPNPRDFVYSPYPETLTVYQNRFKGHVVTNRGPQSNRGPQYETREETTVRGRVLSGGRVRGTFSADGQYGSSNGTTTHCYTTSAQKWTAKWQGSGSRGGR